MTTGTIINNTGSSGEGPSVGVVLVVVSEVVIAVVVSTSLMSVHVLVS
jgi:hypothetical protein